MTRVLLASLIGCFSLLWGLGCETGEYLEDDAGYFESDEEGSDGDLSSRATSVGLYQAEKFTAQSGCKIATNNAGYTGTGFVDYGANGTWIEFNNVNVAQAGNYTLKFRFATASGSRQCAVLINGANVGNVAFSSTGSWTTWGTASLTKSLKAGNNTIRILANTSSGGPNLDSMEVLSTIVDNCPSDPNKTEPGQCGCGVPEGSCSACKNTLAVNERLSAGQYRCSADGRFKFGMSSGGNLALLDGTKTLWSANTCCGAAFVVMQGDGNLVVYDGSSAKWSSKTAGKSGATLTVENNGKAVIRYNGSIIWSVGSSAPVDNCPNDPNKTEPGQCGCGKPEGTCSNGQKVRFFVVGDTQKQINQNPTEYNNLMSRLPQESTKMGIDFILQMGDITEDSLVSNWERARTGWHKLDGITPYVLAVGNNDQSGDRYNSYFPLSAYKTKESFVSNYDNHNNVAHEFYAGGVDWLIISLKVFAGSGQTNWAAGVIKDHPDHNVIIINHDDNGSGPASNLANNYDNVKFVLAGHNKPANSGSVKVNKFGHKWIYFKQCWHSHTQDDYFALIEIDISTGVSKGRYYSPHEGKYWSDPTASFYSARPSWDNWTWNGVTFIK